MPLHGINLSVLMAQGHSQLYFRLEVMKKPLGIISLLIGALGGTVGIAWAVASFGMVPTPAIAGGANAKAWAPGRP